MLVLKGWSEDGRTTNSSLSACVVCSVMTATNQKNIGILVTFTRAMFLAFLTSITVLACSVEREEKGPNASLVGEARNGDVESMLRLADIHMARGSTEEDKQKAIEWLRIAAEQGSSKAQWGMVMSYEYGQGFYDGQEAAKWLHEAAGQGHMGARLRLASWYSMGNVVKESHAESRKWDIRAAEQGNVEAQVRVGDMFRAGWGGEESLEKSLYWYRKAANQGNGEAQRDLGLMYFKGEGVEKNNALAFVWSQMALLNGGTEYAADNVEYIKSVMSEDQVVEAEIKAKKCLVSGYQDC